jgi:predicted DNA binding CopG/RHH family protein
MEARNMNTELNAFQQDIEESEPAYRVVSQAKKQEIETILDSARKTRNINIRISEQDLAMLKDLPAAEGLPYQTLLASILHKYVTNQLVEERSVLNAMRLLKLERG